MLSYGAYYLLFRRMGLKLAGQAVTPHSLRNTLATTLLARDPRALPLAAALAHRGVTTTSMAYNQPGSLSAQALWAEAAAEIKRISKGRPAMENREEWS